MEETAQVHKRSVLTGRVTVRTETRVEEDLVSATLVRDDVEVVRVPFDHVVEQAPPVRNEGEVTIIPVVEERLVVEKRLVLVEEIHVRRVQRTEDVSIPIQLRKQTALVERSEPEFTQSTEPREQ